MSTASKWTIAIIVIILIALGIWWYAAMNSAAYQPAASTNYLTPAPTDNTSPATTSDDNTSTDTLNTSASAGVGY